MTTFVAPAVAPVSAVVEAYRLDRYDNFKVLNLMFFVLCCRSLSFG